MKKVLLFLFAALFIISAIIFPGCNNEDKEKEKRLRPSVVPIHLKWSLSGVSTWLIM